jgi:hypothetical protein
MLLSQTVELTVFYKMSSCLTSTSKKYTTYTKIVNVLYFIVFDDCINLITSDFLPTSVG